VINHTRVVTIESSPLAPGASPARIHYRDHGEGPPIVFLHGGWGYEIYPLQRQMDALAAGHRVVIPDRSGYGGSGAIDALPPDFHRRAAIETLAVLDALQIERPVLWGHSDGAIIALLLGLAAPGRIAGAIVEATHYVKRKPQSRAFFESIIANPESLGPTVAGVLSRDHGDRWKALLELHSRAWLEIDRGARSGEEDFYGGRLSTLQVPILAVHGARDPRTEPGELDALRAALERRPVASAPATFVVLADGGHSPHTERATSTEVTEAVRDFVERHAPAHPADRARPALPAQPADPAR
jgi:pimeloyl-ACP methyl ester carboxylesterase